MQLVGLLGKILSCYSFHLQFTWMEKAKHILHETSLWWFQWYESC